MIDEIKRIGIFGGSFDPPHDGHLAMARKAMDFLNLDCVLFVPCYQNPLKDITGHASPFHRYVMTQLAVLVENRFLVTPLEINRRGKSYMIDTLKDLSKTGYEMHLIMGMDSFQTIGKWKDIKLFPDYCRIAVFSRDETTSGNEIPSGITDISTIISGFDMDISSTEIRKKIRSGENVDREVPPMVQVYIDKYELYRHFRDQNRLIENPPKDYFMGYID